VDDIILTTMNLLDSIKAKATAGELALIEKVEAAVKTDANTEAFRKTLEFIHKNPPEIHRSGGGFDIRTVITQEWADKLSKCLSS